MKSLNSNTFLLAALLAASPVFAEEAPANTTNNFISKRPYEQAVTNTAQNKDVQWEGATLINTETQADKNGITMRLHMLGKRPYAEKATD